MIARVSQFLAKLTPEQLESLNTTRDKHLTGKWLTYATAVICLFAFMNEVLDGGERSMRMATAIMDSWLLFLAAYLGINVAQYGVKRVTDRDTQVQVATAKASTAPPTVVAGNVGTVEANNSPITSERPAIPQKPATEPDNRTDDERGT